MAAGDSYEYVTVERRGRATVVTINRPGSMNALTAKASHEMGRVFDAFAADPEQWVAIITGAGERAFCAGNDLKQVLEEGEEIVPASGFGGLTQRFDMAKPLIAAVNGLALGGGFELALACDLIVASQTATFALPEVRVGLAAMGGGLLHLPRHVGPKRAMEMILTGRRISAEEALTLGLVNEVVAPSEVLPAALRLADRILECSPLSVRASKAVVKRALEADIAEAITTHLDYPEIVQMRASDDAQEGPRAFAEKRAPQWAGR